MIIFSVLMFRSTRDGSLIIYKKVRNILIFVEDHRSNEKKLSIIVRARDSLSKPRKVSSW